MEEKVLLRIEKLRDEMNQMAKDRGIHDPEVLMLSKEIDALHNKLNSLHSDHPQNPVINRDYLKESSRGYPLFYTA